MGSLIDDDPELWHGLTLIRPGQISYQVREAEFVVAPVGARQSAEDGQPFTVPLDEARRLRDLLNIATARGAL